MFYNIGALKNFYPSFDLIQEGLPPKMCHTYPTMMELSTVTPCLKKVKKL